jgi:hypothetical protein
MSDLFNQLKSALKPVSQMDDYNNARIESLLRENQRISDILADTLESLEYMYDNVTDVYEGVDPYDVHKLIMEIKNATQKNS